MKLREARKKIFGQGGDLAIHGGDQKFFGWGGDSPFMLGTAWAQTTVFSQSLGPKQITIFTVVSTTTTTQPTSTHHRKEF